ncbi:WD40-repeat-containing domain protein [Syncephalis fuscata]|nr:WD40-repeat-containing domain protein [Syncephalis fuscata]
MRSLEQKQRIFDRLHTRECVRGHTSRVQSVRWSQDGRRLASCAHDRTARIWYPERSTDPHNSFVLKGHTDTVDQLCWSPTDPDRLATASGDKNTTRCSRIIPTDGENINICWSPDGKQIAVGNKNDVVTFIDTNTYEIIHKTTKQDYEINEIGWNRAGDQFFLTTNLGQVKILSYPSLDEVTTLSAHTSNCYCLDFDSSGRYMATGSADAIVSLWDLTESLCVNTFCELEWPVRTISFTFDGQFLASASEDKFINISCVMTGDSVYKIPVVATINTCSWHPSKYLLAYSGDYPKDEKHNEGAISIFGFTS